MSGVGQELGPAVSVHPDGLESSVPAASPSSTGSFAGTIRDRLLQRFAAWLDGTLDEEPLPEGIAAEIWSGQAEEGPGAAKPTDWYSLWQAMTVLAQEVKLQGRSFKQLSDTLEPVTSLEVRVDAALEAHAEALSQALRLAEEARALRADREREIRRDTEQRVRREMLAVLIEMKDRLDRGLRSMRVSRQAAEVHSRKGWWNWRRSNLRREAQSWQAALDALEAGYGLSLATLEENLRRFDLQEIPCIGHLFDARLMSVVDRKETSDLEEGTVLEVYQTGYLWQGELFRLAQVKVACAPSQLGEKL